jgi:hypothetical protein
MLTDLTDLIDLTDRLLTEIIHRLHFDKSQLTDRINRLTHLPN